MTECAMDALKAELLALLLEEEEAAPADGAEQAIGARPAGAPAVVSQQQQRLWFFEQLHGGTAAYNVPVALRLAGRLDPDALRAAVNGIVARHEVLRTAFRKQGGAPVPVVLPQRQLPLPVTELGGLTAQAQQAAVREYARAEAARPFDLERDPLIRLRLLRLADSDHVLLATLHHIVTDGWSMGIFVRELTALYAAFIEGRPASLPPLPIQYGDFAFWQRQPPQQQAQARQLAYWQRALAGAPELLAIPTERPRPPVQSFRGERFTFEIDPATSAGLEALARQARATLFITLLAGVALLLKRYSGQPDLCIGTPVANRDRPELEPLIGFFVNTLVLRQRVRPEASFLELLEQVRASTLEAYAHQEVPFEAVVEALGVRRNESYPPLVQVMLVLQNAPLGQLDLPGLQVSRLPAHSGTVKFDLLFDFSEAQGRLLGAVEYNQDLFDRPLIEGMAACLRGLLAAVVQAPATPVAALNRFPGAPRPLPGGAAAPAPAPACCEPVHPATALRCAQDERAHGTPAGGERLLHHAFEAQAALRPEAVAVTMEGSALTYRELNTRANRLAHHLRALGVGPDRLVALCVERSPEMVVGLLAILKAGGAYLPLDPAYPAARLAYVLGDARPAVLVTEEHLLERLGAAAAGLPVVRLAAQAEELKGQPSDNPAVAVAPDQLAYVIYTSGSTGAPKGAMVTHANVLRLFRVSHAGFGFDSRDVWTLFHAFNFDFSVWEIWGALLYGGRLVIVPFPVSRSPREFWQLLVREGVTVLNQTPSAFAQLLSAGAAERGPLALRYVIFGGEALTPAVVEPWFRRPEAGRTRLVNMYGITETTVHVTYRPLATAEEAGDIGVPLADLGVLLLDGDLNPVPAGVAGEIFVTGAGLARGYLGRPHLTAERFLPNPYAGTPGERMYRSGDLACCREDGSLVYLGRADEQVKIRGFRIELGEVQAAVCALPEVAEAVVIARELQPGEKRLVAYVVARPEAAGGQGLGALRERLRERLPDYMLPAHIVAVAALPLTVNGKLDRAALPAPECEAGAGGEAPQGESEAALAALWQEVLGLGAVGARDDFFDLGGNSLLAVRLHALVQERLGINLSLGAILRAPTVRGMAELLAQWNAAASRLLVPLRQGSGGGAPLFLLHPAGGTLFCYTRVVEQMTAAGAVYGVQSPEAAGLATEAYGFDELCRLYLREMEAICPAGPLRLAGWSFGGALALHMAGLLEAAGRVVEWVGLVDLHTQLPEEERISFELFVEKLCEEAARDEHLALEGELADAAAKLRAAAGGSGRAIARTLQEEPQWLQRCGVPPEYIRFLRQQYATQVRQTALLSQFEPRPIAAPLLVIRAEQEQGAAQAGWLQFTRAPERSCERVLPGDHRSVLLIAANARAIARAFSGGADAARLLCSDA